MTTEQAASLDGIHLRERPKELHVVLYAIQILAPNAFKNVQHAPRPDDFSLHCYDVFLRERNQAIASL